MSKNQPPTYHLILSAFDREQWCPVLQTRFQVPALDEIKALLGSQADDDPDLRQNYFLEPAEIATIIERFGVPFDSAPLNRAAVDLCLYRPHSIESAPYLIHTGYELPLLLDGRKKLAKMYGPYPPMTFEGEDRFDHWVAQGILHREEVIEPFERPRKNWLGHREVYYTLKGEEWRIPAMKLIWQASGKSGGWNEHFERLEGMLFGYEDWQNDWWIEAGRKRGGFRGAALCCAVTEAGLAWLESAGFRALPPCDKPELAVAVYNDAHPGKMRTFLKEQPGAVALVVFTVGLWRVRDLLPLSPTAERWMLPRERIPELNRHLREEIAIAMRRDALSEDEGRILQDG